MNLSPAEPIIGWQYNLSGSRFLRQQAGAAVVCQGVDGLRLYAPAAFSAIQTDMEAVLAGGGPLQRSYPLLQGSGTTVLSVILNAQGNPEGVSALLSYTSPLGAPAHDAQPNLYETIAQIIPIDLVVFDAQHRFVYVGEQTVKDPEVRAWMIGRTEAEYCRLRNINDSVISGRSIAFQACISEGKVVHYEEALHRNGQVLYKVRSFQPVLDGAGNTQFVIGFGHDITSLKESEHIIRRQHMAIDAVREGIGLLNKEGNFYYVNQAHASIFGYASPEELLGKSWKTLYGAAEIQRIENEIFPLLAANAHWGGETSGFSKSGTVVRQEVILTLLPDGDLVCICRDVSEARRQADELKKLALVVENTSSGVVITNAELEIEWVNAGFQQITGYTLEEVKGKKQSMLLREQHREMLNEIQQLALAGKPFNGELLDYTKLGVPCWISIKGQPIIDEKGRVIKYFTIQEDITYRKAMEQDLIVAKEAAEASARSKRRFLANMSHEIRTPMNAVMGLTAQLLKTELNETQRFFANTIDTAARNLLTIINDILDISKIEEGKLQIECLEMNLHEVLQRMMHVLQHKAEEKGIAFSLQIAPGLPKQAMGDPYRLNQVLLNVVGNAIKFTEHGSVSVACNLAEVQGDKVIEIAVTDTGIGMDADTLKHVFEEFFSQGEQGFVRRFGGTGLGLPISKSLVELMEGSLDVQSLEGRGTQVLIRIPYLTAELAILAEEPEAAPDFARLKGCAVLLVEDNKFNSLVARLMLRNAGLEVSLAENGEEAVDAVSKQDFNIILMDIQMPVMDGVSATAAIRGQLFCDTPIIALTAHALREEKDSYLAAGMNDFLSKPFQEQELLALLHKWICQKNVHYV